MESRSANPLKAIWASAKMLRDAQIASFPLDISKLFAFFKGKIQPICYSTYARKLNCSIADVISTCGNDGDIYFCYEYPQNPEDGVYIPEEKILLIYNESSTIPRQRKRHTATHEFGHSQLKHQKEVGLSNIMLSNYADHPLYNIWEKEADIFARNSLCPAICAVQVLNQYGYGIGRMPGEPWTLDLDSTSLLHRRKFIPTPEQILSNVFDLSKAAAYMRLSELDNDLAFFMQLPDDLIHYFSSAAYRLTCIDCGHTTMSPSLFCHNCGGQNFGYVPDAVPPLPEPVLRPTHQFAFCPGCGETDYSSDALYCPSCGHPLLNPCEGLNVSPALRSYCPATELPHYCRATEQFCGKCGASTRIAFDPPLRKRAWAGTPVPTMEALLRRKVTYSRIPYGADLRPKFCPDCGSTRIGHRLCLDCNAIILNDCKNGHPCSPNDRYCTKCGKKTSFLANKFLKDYLEEPAFLSLFEEE